MSSAAGLIPMEVCSESLLQDLLLLDHLGDIGMSEMIFLMRMHVQEVARFSTLIGYKLYLTTQQRKEFEQDCQEYGVAPEPFLLPVEAAGTPLSVVGIQLLKICAKVHDIGKPFFRKIYQQERRLSEEEFNQQKLHANLSRLIIKGWLNHSQFHFHYPQLVRMVADFAAQHQEKFDGSGYPDGLKGEQTSLMGRLLAIADAISAIVNPRPYEEATPLEQCLLRLEKDRGNHFDPLLLDQSATILRNEVTNAPRFSGEWEDLKQHSSDYIDFVGYIDFEGAAAETILVGRGERESLEQLQALVEEVLEYHQQTGREQ